jgi:glycosyltransferase involved in cell wall biosynthesis
MRLLFAQVNAWTGSKSGGLIAQRLCAEGIARLGHECHVIVRLFDPRNDRPHLTGLPTDSVEYTFHQTREALEAQGIPYREIEPDGIAFELSGVQVHAIGNVYGTYCSHLEQRIRELEPDWIQVTDVDDGPPFLDICQRESGGRVIAHFHSVSHMPFGPQALAPHNPERARALRALRGVICPSRFGCEYARQYGGLDATPLYYDIYGKGPFPDLASFDRGYVTAINPCDLKGLAVFVELARAMPDVAFAAVPTWGRSPEVMAQLQALDNVEIWPPVDDIDEIFARTRVLLAPALWLETFGMTIVEAQLRGIPVLASDLGGHRESKLGVDHLLPVNPLRLVTVDGQRQMTIPEQDVAPWVAALRHLLTDRDEYNRVSRASRAAATRFVHDIGWEHFVDHFERLAAAPAR